MLGHADAVGAGRVHDQDAARTGGDHVDVVHAGSGAGDHPKLRRCGNQRFVNGRGAANYQRDGVGKVTLQSARRASAASVDRDVGSLLQNVER